MYGNPIRPEVWLLVVSLLVLRLAWRVVRELVDGGRRGERPELGVGKPGTVNIILVKVIYLRQPY